MRNDWNALDGARMVLLLMILLLFFAAAAASNKNILIRTRIHALGNDRNENLSVSPQIRPNITEAPLIQKHYFRRARAIAMILMSCTLILSAKPWRYLPYKWRLANDMLCKHILHMYCRHMLDANTENFINLQYIVINYTIIFVSFLSSRRLPRTISFSPIARHTTSNDVYVPGAASFVL